MRSGATYELGGPLVLSMRELLAYVLAETGRHRRLVTVPMGLARLQAAVLERVPGKPLTRDQLLMLQHDNVVAAGMPGWRSWGLCRRRWTWWCRRICGGSGPVVGGGLIWRQPDRSEPDLLFRQCRM